MDIEEVHVLHPVEQKRELPELAVRDPVCVMVLESVVVVHEG